MLLSLFISSLPRFSIQSGVLNYHSTAGKGNTENDGELPGSGYDGRGDPVPWWEGGEATLADERCQRHEEQPGLSRGSRHPLHPAR